MTTARARVLRVITRLNIGGPARQALLLTKELDDEYPTVLAAGHAPREEGDLLDPLVPVHRVPLVRPIKPRSDVRAALSLHQLMKSVRPQIIHTHMAKAGTIGRLVGLRQRSKPLLVHTFHGHVLDAYFSPPAERAFIAMERWLAARTDALIAVSPQVRDQLLDLGIGTPSRFHVIPLGFDLSGFLAVEGPNGILRKELELDPAAPLLGIVGRLAPIKDHQTMLKAMTELPEAHLAIVGDGELRGELVVQAQRLGVADRTHFVGWRRDVADVMADLDVVVLTSRNEGTPVSAIEALAAARPVVATAVGGVEFVVKDGVNGMLVPPGDVSGVATAIRKLIKDAKVRASFGQAGRGDVSERFHYKRLVEDIGDLYRDLLGQQGSAPAMPAPSGFNRDQSRHA